MKNGASFAGAKVAYAISEHFSTESKKGEQTLQEGSNSNEIVTWKLLYLFVNSLIHIKQTILTPKPEIQS